MMTFITFFIFDIPKTRLKSLLITNPTNKISIINISKFSLIRLIILLIIVERLKFFRKSSKNCKISLSKKKFIQTILFCLTRTDNIEIYFIIFLPRISMFLTDFLGDKKIK